MESQHQDQNGQHQTQQLQHQQQEHHQDHLQSPPAALARVSGKAPSRSAGSSRSRRHSSSSFSGVLNFGASPAPSASPHARTPANRGRHSHSKSHSEISSAAVAAAILAPLPSSSSSSSSAMELPGGDRGDDRPDKAAKQQSPPQHSSFTFATPQNPRNTPGRKRARTLEYPTTDPQAASDDAKVKGGHSLRKRARVDYAQMNEHEDDVQAPTHATEGTMEITVSAARSSRKRRATADQNHEDEDPQSAILPPHQKKKPRTVEKQRTVSPIPQRRPQKRKSTVAATITLESPEQQHPSDTELKDTIEVGAPMASHSIPSSSQAQSSETASNVSGQSPSQTTNPSPAVASRGDAARAQNNSLPTANGSTATSNLKDTTGLPVAEESVAGDTAVSPSTNLTATPPKNSTRGNKNGTDLPTESSPPKQNGAQNSSEPSATAAVADEDSQAAHETVEGHMDRAKNLTDSHTSSLPRASSEAPQSTHQPSSQESVDSDTTDIQPPTLIPIAASSAAEPLVGERSRATSRAKGKQPVAEAQAPQEEPDEVKQDAPKLGLRPRRQRSSRLAESTVAVQEDESPSQPPKEKVTPSNRKSDDKLKSADRSAAQEDAGPSSPETPRRRGPGRPPKNRVLPESENAKPPVTRGRERRASRTTTRLEHPRPVRSLPPKDFSFLTPYLDTRELYPEVTQEQESGMPTPLETPNLQPSDVAVDEQPEDGSSLGAEKDSGSQDLQAALDGDTASNAPTPAVVYDAPTPATAAESAAPSRNASPEPTIESMRKAKQRRQYAFPRIRSPTEFINHLEDYKNMSDEDLSNILAVSANALATWQEEWKKQKALVDDEDNAVRRRAHDIAFVAREARDMAKSTGSVTLEKRDFEVKGIRADRVHENKADFPLSNPEAYERRQDMVAAQAWGFEWDPRPSMIGKQDPIAQREGLQNTRLRNRPKLSQRAAEAAIDEPVGIVPGKRTRKPRILSDESKDPSRAPTPVEPAKPKRRRRRNMEAELAESDNEAQNEQPEDLNPETEEFAPPVPSSPTGATTKKPYTGKKRGPKPKAEKEAAARAAAEREAAEKEAAAKAAQDAAAEEAAAAAATAAEAEAEAAAAQREQKEAEADQPKTRKRRRAAAAPEIQPQDIPTASIEDIQPDGPANRQAPQEDELPAPKRQRARKPKVEIPTATFYSTASSVPTHEDTLTPAEEKRPSTSSSTSSMRTNESSYSFRHRPRKNYSELADPPKEILTEPRPRRARKRANAHDEPEPTSYPANLAPAPYPGEPHYPMVNHGYHVQQPSVLAPPNNNPFLPPTGGHPGPLLAPSPLRPSHVAAPPVVGANPFSAPSNTIPVESPAQHHTQSPRKKPLRIKIINRRGQTATPQTDGPPQHVAPPSQNYPPMQQQAQGLAPLQPPPSFHGHHGNYDPQMFNGPPHSITGSGPGQVMFPVNAAHGATMSISNVMHHAPPPMPPLGNAQGQQGSVTGSRANSKPPGSGRATPAPSSAASSTGGGGQLGDEGLSEKDYASMTKSEKMSASMKARWANGSMRQAVNKRKETLARKKQSQADKSVPGSSVTPTPQPESAPPPSAQGPVPIQGTPVTPILHHQQGSNELPTPIGLPPPQHHHHHHGQPPPPHGYMHMMSGGPHDNGGHHPGGGVVLPPPSAMAAGSMAPHMMDGPPTYPPPHGPRREPARQNPFLDHGYADRGPRLPFFPNGPEDMNDGRYDQWGPRQQ